MSRPRWWTTLARAVGMRGLVYSTLALVLGTVLGLGVFTFGYAGGWAYFGNNPQTCVQCHAMNDQYSGWLKGSHKNVASCNDCHAPHGNYVAKYINKADNGFWHSLKFTTRDYPMKIQIRPHNKQITEHACVYCHKELTETIHVTRTPGEQISCIRCHTDVGHKR
ncbi:cytochrome c nitrite reductase small subunit [Mobilicoccus pelagius]|uniref:Cytochrome c-type protein n=1 Tax=Mobilicoccus pelagius NBRC 104925 TaxID=1089455 RepID=H5US92_9MICO|nr:cytochrome c nitrite reductase small subunit [Mobilicoccus pelagius]GAB48600.1 cytochrome c-type protein NrfH [Mobilicoccus pelagius NBRC 104925]